MNLWSSVLGHVRKVARDVYCCMHGPIFEAVNVFFAFFPMWHLWMRWLEWVCIGIVANRICNHQSSLDDNVHISGE